MAIVYDTNIYNTKDCILRYKMSTLPSSMDNMEGNCAFIVGEEDILNPYSPTDLAYINYGKAEYKNIVDSDFSSESLTGLGSILFTSNKYMISTSLPVVETSKIFSFSFWVKKTTGTAASMAFSLKDPSSNRYGLKFLNNYLYWSYNEDSLRRFLKVSDNTAYSTSDLYESWHLYTIVQDAAYAYLYIDGVKVAKTTCYNIDPDVMIVGNSPSYSMPLGGRLYDLRFYKKTLSDNDVLELYQDRVKSDINGAFYANFLIESDDNLASFIDSTIKLGLNDSQSTISATVGNKTYAYGNGIMNSDGSGTNKLLVSVSPGKVSLQANGLVGKGGFILDTSKINNGILLTEGRKYAIVFDVAGFTDSTPDIYGFFQDLSSASGIQYANSQVAAAGDNANRYFIFDATAAICSTTRQFIIGWSSLSGKTISLEIETLQFYDITDRVFDVETIRRLQGTTYTELSAFQIGENNEVLYGKNGAVVATRVYEG